MNMMRERTDVQRLLPPAVVGLIIGLAGTPRPITFCLWAIAVPWFIARKQGFSKGGIACALAFAVPACAGTLSRVVISAHIDTLTFVLAAVALSPLAVVAGVVGLNICGLEARQVTNAGNGHELPAHTDSLKWIAKVPSSVAEIGQFSESKVEGIILG